MSTWKDDKAFVETLTPLLKEEGGFQRNPFDNGNWSGGRQGVGKLIGTKYGIAAASHPGLDIPNLTQDDAAAIYYQEYWIHFHYNELPGEIGVAVMDLAPTNPSGTHHALQRATWSVVGKEEYIIDDGDLGRDTIDAVLACAVKELHVAFRSEMAAFYRLVHAAKTARGQVDPFLHGWLIRAYRA